MAPGAGGVEPRPYGGVTEVRRKEESPSHGFAVPAPFRQGGEGTGEADCHTSDIGHWFAMTWFFAGGAWQVVPCAVAHIGATLRRLMVKKRAG